MKAERATASNSGSHPGSKGAKSPVGHTPVDLLYEKGIQLTLAKLLAELDPVEILGTVVYVVLSIWGKSNDLVLPFWLFLALLAGYHALARPIIKNFVAYVNGIGESQVQSGAPPRPRLGDG